MNFLLPSICQDKDFLSCRGIAEKDYAANVSFSDVLTNAILKWNTVLRDFIEEDANATRCFVGGLATPSWGDFSHPPSALFFCAFLKKREAVLSTISQFFTDAVDATMRVLEHRRPYDAVAANGLDEFTRLRAAIQTRYDGSYDALKYIVHGTEMYVTVLETSLDTQDVVDALRPLLGALRMVWVCSTTHGQKSPHLYGSYVTRIAKGLWARADHFLGAALVRFCSGSEANFPASHIAAKTKVLAVEEMCVVWAEAVEYLPLGPHVSEELARDTPARLHQRCVEALHTTEMLRAAIAGMTNRESTAYCLLEESRGGLQDALGDVASFLDPFESLVAWRAACAYVENQCALARSEVEARLQKEQKGIQKGTAATPAIELRASRSSVVKSGPLSTMLLIMVTLNPPVVTVVGPARASTLERLAESLPGACATTQGRSRDPTPKFERRPLMQTLQQQATSVPYVDHTQVLTLSKHYVHEDAHFLVTILDIVEIEGGWVLRDGDASFDEDTKHITHKLLFQRKVRKDV